MKLDLIPIMGTSMVQGPWRALVVPNRAIACQMLQGSVTIMSQHTCTFKWSTVQGKYFTLQFSSIYVTKDLCAYCYSHKSWCAHIKNLRSKPFQYLEYPCQLPTCYSVHGYCVYTSLLCAKANKNISWMMVNFMDVFVL